MGVRPRASGLGHFPVCLLLSPLCPWRGWRRWPCPQERPDGGGCGQGDKCLQCQRQRRGPQAGSFLQAESVPRPPASEDPREACPPHACAHMHVYACACAPTGGLSLTDRAMCRSPAPWLQVRGTWWGGVARKGCKPIPSLCGAGGQEALRKEGDFCLGQGQRGQEWGQARGPSLANGVRLEGRTAASSPPSPAGTPASPRVGAREHPRAGALLAPVFWDSEWHCSRPPPLGPTLALPSANLGGELTEKDIFYISHYGCDAILG